MITKVISKYILSAVIILTSTVSFAQDQVLEPADYVNPMIGCSTSHSAAKASHGLGKTFPGATTPFGMTQVSPQSIHGADNSSGYSDEHRTIEGFAITQMSGVGWFGELGNFLVMPTTGPLKTVAGKEDGSITGYRSAYDKSSELAKAGYYSVFLSDYGIKVETTASTHCGLYRFTFPKNKLSRYQIDLARRVAGSSDYQHVEVIDEHTFEGWIRCTPNGGGWGNGKGNVNYTLYFHAHSDKPLKNIGFFSVDIPDDWGRKRDDVTSLPYLERVADAEIIRGRKSMDGKHIGIFNEFKTAEGEQVTLKVGISFVDIVGARKNFDAEVASIGFDEAKTRARQMWNDALSKILVSGGTDEEKVIFYTSMYHSCIDPRIYTDVDGRYVGGNLQIFNTEGQFTKRTIFSGWDVFRSQFPLHCIINPEMVNDEINSLVTLAEQSKRFYFERWEHMNSYSGCMLGNPALSVLADAYVKGIRGYDVDKAYEYCINTSHLYGNDKYGYTPGKNSISYTLEYAYFDWCVAQLAKALGKDADAAVFEAKGQCYRNLYDPSVGWFRPRKENGDWEPWPGKGRLKDGYGSKESNPYQQGWFVPHDIPGMVELMGGREHVMADLLNFFEKMPHDMLWNSYYNHANEPVHLVPFMFNLLDTPWNTQKWSRAICTRAYSNKVEGLVGNEDAGQMSAWYILAAAGIHPSCPGNTRYEITSPVFNKVVIALDRKYAKGSEFTIVAHGNSPKNIYIQKAVLNGEEYDKCHIDYMDIAAGGVLELYMGDKPNFSWGLGK